MAALAGGCNGDYETSLPGGLKLVRTNSATKVIFGPEGMIIAAKVTRVGWNSDGTIAGLVEPSPDSEVVSHEVVGFFLIEPTGLVRRGLTEEQLKQLALDAHLSVPAMWATR